VSNSKRRCKHCKKYFPADQCVTVPAGTFCSMSHAVEWAQKPNEREKAQRKRHHERKRRLTDGDRSHWTKKAQTAFNAYIRERDKDLPCVSCGRHHQGQYHAGHYRTTAAAPELRFDERNCHKQCAPCNNHKSGNITEYRIELIRRIGEGQADWLEGPHKPKKYAIDDLKLIHSTYSQKLKELKSD